MVDKVTPIRKVQKLPPEDWETVDLEIFSSTQALDIQDMAYGLSEQEVCDHWGIEYELLSENDKWFFDVNYRKGQAQAKKKAVDCLFKQMAVKGGKDASMAYLLRFSDEWDGDVEDKTGDRTYKLVLE